MNELTKLKKINELLKINNNKKLVFVYSAPKVGSTSVVSSLRLFGIKDLDIIHIHDEVMMQVLMGENNKHLLENIKILDIINYNASIGKQVYVINIYRSPIERKISAYFEKIGSHHFNNTDENVNTYPVDKIITRFNNIFPHIANGDHFVDLYNIQTTFPYNNKHIHVVQNGITYISLRLKDSSSWSDILTNIFGFKILIVKDYESNKKPIQNLYRSFLAKYKIPINLLDSICNDLYLNYYYSPEERNEYIRQWSNKCVESYVPYNKEQYALYESITLENNHMDIIQLDHYLDEGCSCKACNIKRYKTVSNILSNKEFDKVTHIDAKNEYLTQKCTIVNKIQKQIKKNKKPTTFMM